MWIQYTSCLNFVKCLVIVVLQFEWHRTDCNLSSPGVSHFTGWVSELSCSFLSGAPTQHHNHGPPNLRNKWKKKCLVYDGFTFTVDRFLTNGDASWQCTSNKSNCKTRIRTDVSGIIFVKVVTEHNHPSHRKTLSHDNLQCKWKNVWTRTYVIHLKKK